MTPAHDRRCDRRAPKPTPTHRLAQTHQTSAPDAMPAAFQRLRPMPYPRTETETGPAAPQTQRVSHIFTALGPTVHLWPTASRSHVGRLRCISPPPGGEEPTRAALRRSGRWERPILPNSQASAWGRHRTDMRRITNNQNPVSGGGPGGPLSASPWQLRRPPHRPTTTPGGSVVPPTGPLPPRGVN
jgi:hypothetical protein